MKKIIVLGLVILLSSCAFLEESTKNGFGKTEKENKIQDVQEYTAIGEDSSLMKSLNKAKVEAIRQGVIDIIGLYSEQTNQEKLKEQLYNTERPNKWVINQNMEVLQKSKTGNIYICKIKIPVKMKEVANYLKSIGITEQQELQANLGVKQKPKDADTILAEAIANNEDKDNIQFLQKYIENMVYMVYSSEKSKTDRFLLKSGVETANGYLLKQGYRAIDSAQVEKLKKDNAIVYQESSDTGMDAIQFIAQKLNADVYLELDAETEGGYERDGYYGSAKITLKIFNPSTGELLGAVPYSSPKTFSTTSSFDAQSNAIQSTVYKALPIAIDQAKILLAKAYSNGIRYEIIINDTPDSKSMARFRRELKRHCEVRTIHQSKAQTKYAVFLFGSIDDLETMLYDVSDKVMGFENIELIMLRGKSLTLKSGF